MGQRLITIGLSLALLVGVVVVYTVFLGTPGNPGLITRPEKSTAIKPAPIEAAEITVLESSPPQYVVKVVYGLRNGCVKPAGFEVQRFNRAIAVKVNVEEPTDVNAVCTQVYATSTHEVNLGSDFKRGESYRVEVNGKPVAFTAQ